MALTVTLLKLLKDNYYGFAKLLNYTGFIMFEVSVHVN